MLHQRQLMFAAGFGFAVAVLSLVTQPTPPVQATVPFTALDSCVITVTSTGTLVSSLITTAGCASVTAAECFKVANDKAGLICLGPSTVAKTVTAGDRCWPICTLGADCAEGNTSVPYKTTGTYLRSAAATQKAYLLLGNGC